MRECGCWPWVVKCRHIDGQWVLAILECVRSNKRHRFVLVGRPGFKLGRERYFHDLPAAEEEFSRREEALLA